MKNYKDNVGAGPVSAQKGITLIALVITIIVMLILVAVTISMAINGGLFQKAGEAVGDTQNSINAEQQLANGKIKIDGKWYASIDDYINNNPIKSGLEVTPTEIALKKNEEGAEGEEVLTGTITASIFGMESEPEISWETTSEAITLSSTTGKTVTVTAVGTENTEITVTAKCTYEGEEYTAKSEITLEIIKKPVEIARGDFVEYGVAYTDACISKEYTTTNGWRLLDYTDNGDGTISDVELISTGIPAKLRYPTSGSADWIVTNKTTEFKTKLQNYYGNGTSSYTFYSNTGCNVYATAGMYYNFENIPFYPNSSYSYLSYDDKQRVGSYDGIKVNGIEVTGTIYGSIFLISNDYSVRMLTLPEINNDRSNIDGITITSTTKISSTHEPATGLYVLQNIDDTGLSSYTYTTGAYWLASPDLSSVYYSYCVYYNEVINANGNGYRCSPRNFSRV